jgi:ATP-binding cassette, subfamily B, bacterial
VTELSRVALLSGLPGEKLGEIAKQMEREEIPPGRAVVREGEHSERFYVVLSGLFAVSQEDLGPRRVLRPGDYFGEVGLAMQIPRTASVRALTPAVVASCDRAAFDQFLRPLFAEDT